MISQMSPLSFWEAMEKGKVSRFYVQQLPEEFRSEYEPMIDMLEKQYANVLSEIIADTHKLADLDMSTMNGKKTLGLMIQSGKHSLKHPGAMFSYFGESGDIALNKYIMKHIRPTGNVMVCK